MLPAIVPPDEAIDLNNHRTRNILAPALSSAELLEEYWDRMTPEQIQKHLGRIKTAIGKQVALMEEGNRDIAEGKVVVFRRRD